MTERIDKLKAELPEHCWKCGDYTGTGDCIECHWSPVIKALTDGLKEAEQKGIENYSRLAAKHTVMVGTLVEERDSLRAQLTAEQAAHEHSMEERDVARKNWDLYCEAAGEAQRKLTAEREARTAAERAILKTRDALIQMDADDAYNTLYWFACSMAADPYKPWAELEARAALKGGSDARL